MAFPNRTEFFATGLVPVTNNNEPCSICIDTMTEPVKLPCNHVFCKACILEWLAQPITNSCAMCRRPLYDIEAPQHLINNPRRGQASRAHGSSGLADNFWVTGTPSQPGDVAPYTRVETFGGRIPFTSTLLRASSAAAIRVLSAGNPVNSRAGPTRISRGNVAVSIITMSNLLSSMADQQSRPYGAAGRAAWHEIAENVYRIFADKDGIELDAMVLPAVVMRHLDDKLARRMGEPLGNFFSDRFLKADLEMLIGFVVYEARQRSALLALQA